MPFCIKCGTKVPENAYFTKKIAIMLVLSCATIFAQDAFNDPRDGKIYKTVKIGSQVWMAQNLDYAGEDGYLGLCYGDIPRQKIRKPENCQKYGRLYNWETAMKVCPKGWHLPSNAEWDKLLHFVDGAGSKSPYHNSPTIDKHLKAVNGWNDDGNGTDYYGFSESSKSPYHSPTAGKHLKAVNGWNDDGNGTDYYGFSALPGGHGYSGGGFRNVGYNGDWWSATEYNAGWASIRLMGYGYSDVLWNTSPRSYPSSVRCVQD